MTLKEDKEILEGILNNDIIHLNLMLHIKKSLQEELSKTVSVLLKQGWTQGYIAKILEIDQPKVSIIKRNTPKMNFSVSMLIKFLRILGVYTIIDTGQDYISDTIKFYTDKKMKKTKMKKTKKVK